MRKLANETWFSQHRQSLEVSIRDTMHHLFAVVAEAKQLIAEEAARYIVRFKQYAHSAARIGQSTAVNPG